MAKMNGKGNSGGGKFMDNAKGMCSYKDNPMSPANEMKYGTGPGSNSDQNKANSLVQRAQKEVESLRGKSGM